VISPERVESFLQELPVEALWGVGPVTAGKLRKVGIERLAQIRAAEMQLLRDTVGSLADWLRQLSYGDDPRPVVPDRESKSSSTENTYAQDLVDADAIRAELDRMARENAEWLAPAARGAHRDHQVRYADFKTTLTRSHTLSRRTSDADLIASCGGARRAHRGRASRCGYSACACTR
jgi:DNA polymerase-4